MDDWGQSARPDRSLGIASTPDEDDYIRPSIEGRDALRYAMSELEKKTPRKKQWYQRVHVPKWLTWKRAVALIIVDLVAAHFAWGWLMSVNQDAITKAVQKTMHDVSHKNWQGVYDSLCRADKAQISEGDLAAAGPIAVAQLGPFGLDHATITSITKIKQSVGPIGTPDAAQVHGQLFPFGGQPSDYSVVMVHEIPGGWKFCMSAGGFDMLGYTEPLGSADFTP